MRRIVRTYLIGLTLAALAVTGCQLLKGAQSPEATVYTCKVAALHPYVGDVFDTEELVRDAMSGKADLERALQSLAVLGLRLEAARAEYLACDPPEPPLVIPPAAGPVKRVLL